MDGLWKGPPYFRLYCTALELCFWGFGNFYICILSIYEQDLSVGGISAMLRLESVCYYIGQVRIACSESCACKVGTLQRSNSLQIPMIGFGHNPKIKCAHDMWIPQSFLRPWRRENGNQVIGHDTETPLSRPGRFAPAIALCLSSHCSTQHKKSFGFIWIPRHSQRLQPISE